MDSSRIIGERCIGGYGVCIHVSAVQGNDGETEEMNAKEYLSQVKELTARYKAKQDEVTSIEALLLQAVSYGKDGSMSHDNNKNERIIIKLMELHDELNQQLVDMADKKSDVIRVINEVEDANEMVVLNKRYLEFKSWHTIEKEMNYSEQHVYYIHRSALETVDKILNHKSK